MASIKKTALYITILVFISKLLGFVREIFLANYFGTSYTIDAYLMAISIPTILFGGFIISVSTTYIPIYTGIREKNKNEESAILFSNNLITVSFILSLFLSIIGIIFSRNIVKLLAPGFSGEVFCLTVKYLKISFLVIISLSINKILTSYLHCNNGFVIEKIANLTFNIFYIIVIIISGIYNKDYLIYGYLLAYLISTVFIYITSIKKGFKTEFIIKIDTNIKNTFKLSLPIFFGSMAWQINSLVDKILASRLTEGSIAALNYAFVINSFIYGLFTIALTTIVFPIFSKQIAKSNIYSFKKTLNKTINILIIILVPIIVGSIILAKPAVVFIYERGAFNEGATTMTYTAFSFYVLGILGMGFKDVINKAFFSMKETKIPMIIGFFSVTINISLNLILIRYMKHNGLALATSISSTITAIFLIISLRRKIGSFELKKCIIIFIKVLLSSVIMGTVVFFSYNYIRLIGIGSFYELIEIIITILLGGIIYLVLVYLMKVEEVEDMVEYIIKR